MPTRLTRTINGQEVDIVRDGFSVYRLDEDSPVFEARRIQLHFGDSQWEYFDDAFPTACRAIFKLEEDVIDYIYWRIEKWMNSRVDA